MYRAAAHPREWKTVQGDMVDYDRSIQSHRGVKPHVIHTQIDKSLNGIHLSSMGGPKSKPSWRDWGWQFPPINNRADSCLGHLPITIWQHIISRPPIGTRSIDTSYKTLKPQYQVDLKLQLCKTWGCIILMRGGKYGDNSHCQLIDLWLLKPHRVGCWCC